MLVGMVEHLLIVRAHIARESFHGRDVSCPYDNVDLDEPAIRTILTGLFTMCLLAGEVTPWDSN